MTSFFVGKKPVIAVIVLVVSVGAAYLYFIRSAARTIDSIAVLPFINTSGALELDENNADAHSYYANLLSNTGRHE